MLIYSAEFYLQPKPDVLGCLKKALKSWLDRKIGPQFRPIRIIPHGHQPLRFNRQDTGPNVVTIIGTPDGVMPYCMTLTYQHNDPNVNGRAWITKIGFEQKDSEQPVRLTVVLETSEVSVLAAAEPLKPSMPGVVGMIVDSCALDDQTPGRVIKTLSVNDLTSFRAELNDLHRHHAILVVSPDEFSEKPVVDVEQMGKRFLGLAQIYVIPTKRDAWSLRNELPPFHTAWDGAVTVISPRRFDRDAFGKPFTQGEMEAIYQTQRVSFEDFLFLELTHRQNLQNSRRHISTEVVGRRLLAYNIARIREQGADVATYEQLVAAYEQAARDAQAKADDLTEQVLNAEARIETIEAEKQQLEVKVQGLRFQLRQLASTSDHPSDQDARRVYPEANTLEAIIELCGEHFGDKLELTNHACRTLRDSPFEDVGRAWTLFQIMGEEFHARFAENLSVEVLQQRLDAIDAHYKPRNSSVTAGMCDGYQRQHNGISYELQKHVGLGSSRDPKYCFRLYFEWEPSSAKIIILHAGKHLETQST